MTIREQTELIEKQILSPYASLSSNTKGRNKFEQPCDLRTEYQRDRDRIIHCKSFRRLKHKTQVFLAPEGDHYRTRLTHTLEVSQLSRTAARALRLNEDLTEAIALGHDLGHTPFGHAGERALDEICPFGFKHYLHSVRVVEKLEKDGNGLNLTYEVRNGIANHTSGNQADTLEGRIVRLCDRIAYINHDIDDAIRAGVLRESDLPSDVIEILGKGNSPRINSLMTSLIKTSLDKNDIKLSEDIQNPFDKLHKFMFKNVYTNSEAKGEESKVDGIIFSLYDYFIKNPDKLPVEHHYIIENEGLVRAVCDHIAGMTDRFAIQSYTDIFVPKTWQVIS